MRAQYKPRIVFSTDQKTATKGENSANYYSVFSNLETVTNFLTAKGVYNGDEERSFILDLTVNNLNFAREAAKNFNQESILLIDNEGIGTLEFTDGRENVKLGKLNVTNTKPEGDYTLVSETKEYFNFV